MYSAGTHSACIASFTSGSSRTSFFPDSCWVMEIASSAFCDLARSQSVAVSCAESWVQSPILGLESRRYPPGGLTVVGGLADRQEALRVIRGWERLSLKLDGGLAGHRLLN